MKKLLLFTIVSVLLLTLYIPAVPAEDLPTINEALSAARFSKSGGRVRVQNTLDAYSIDNEGEFDYDGLRFLILERRAPEKAFDESEVSWADALYPPRELGETALYLRLDMMDRLPSDMRASSLMDADLLLIAEDFYELESQIIHTEYENSGAGSIPDDLETPEELMAYLAEHPPVVKSRTYKPLFTAYAFLSLYSTKNKSVTLLDYAYADCTVECKNEAASDQWSLISPLGDLLDLLEWNDPSQLSGDIAAALDNISSVPEDTVDLWTKCVEAGQYGTAAFSVSQSYWELASVLPSLDDSEDAAEWYPKLLEARDRGAFESFVSWCGYSSVDTPDSVIIAEKLYIGQIDPDWMDNALAGTIAELTQE